MENKNNTSPKNSFSNMKQVIFFGAPGTGKSHFIKEQTENCDVIRTTFHPDSDYSTFVGCFKPTSENGRITYKYVPQVFLKAYIKAWKKYFICKNNKTKETIAPETCIYDEIEKQYLVVEELNRGNCAQIFGDIFQLLDRKNGFSEYSIDTDTDMQILLKDEFKEITVYDPHEKIGDTTIKKILNGEKLVLPCNMYIWATMNTSDQSLFPIDSAFKRRWNWIYMPIVKPIVKGEKECTIEIGESKYDWWNFLTTINKKIEEVTMSEDKKLGYYFCTAEDNIIDEDIFVNKVLFYLWNDVFKREESTIFANGSFNDLFNENGSIRTDHVNNMLKYNGILPISESNKASYVENSNDTNSSEPKNIKLNNGREDEYTINDDFTPYGKCRVPYEAIKKYSEQHQKITAEEIVKIWRNLNIKHLPHLVETEKEHEGRKAQTKDDNFKDRSIELILPNNEVIYVSNQFTPERIEEFITKLNAQDWGVVIHHK